MHTLQQVYGERDMTGLQEGPWQPIASAQEMQVCGRKLSTPVPLEVPFAFLITTYK